ncbi:MAG: thymidylate synthase (FAD), partial [Planctomycetaceae bacterium]|nr:thymidylate synthase (FAD) [Planctomycetaceae bacterium]
MSSEHSTAQATPSLDSLRWKKFPVLDDGFVTVVDVMGNDASVVQAARVSYGEGTRKVSDDRQL